METVAATSDQPFNAGKELSLSEPAISVVQETPGRFNLIANYGMGWERSNAEWEPKAEGLKRHLRMVGERPGRKPANFWSQQGIYVLLLNGNVHYVGIGKAIGVRLDVHMRDEHRDSWNQFHWFGFRPVGDHRDAKGFLELDPHVKRAEVKTRKVLADLEAVLGRVFPGPGQGMPPHFGVAGVEKWLQMPPEKVAEYRSRIKQQQ